MFNPTDGMLSAEVVDETSFQLDHDKNKPNGSFESSLASSFSEAGAMDSAIMSLPCTMLSTERILLEQWKWSYRGEGAANLVISLQVCNCVLFKEMLGYFAVTTTHIIIHTQ